MDSLVTGLVRKPHGLKGYLKAVSLSGEYEHFLRLPEFKLRPAGRSPRSSAAERAAEEKTFAVEDCRLTGDGLLVKLAGINSPEEAGLWRGAEIIAPREAAAPLAQGQYYFADLVGCALVSGGRELAKVRSVLESGAHETLEVTGKDGATWLIPFVEAHVGEVNIGARTIELKSEWLLS